MTLKNGKPTIWVYDQEESQRHSERLSILRQMGFDIHIASDYASFVSATTSLRPSTIIVDTLKDTSQTEMILKDIAMNAELSSARSVLNLTMNSENLKRVAMSANVRDIIAWNIETPDWISRIQYATAPKPLDLTTLLCGVNINQPAVIRVPARLVWINQTHIRIECRGNQKVGNILSLSGPIAEAWGVDHISLTVESVHKDKLLFRFSQAIVARWRIPPPAMNQALSSIASLANQFREARIRIFLAVSKPELRRIAIDAISPERHEINVALTKSSLASELSFFSPDVVIFDDRVIGNLKDEEIIQIFQRTPTDIPLLVIGSNFNIEHVKNILIGRPVFAENNASPGTFANLVSKYNIVQHLHDSIVASQVSQIMADHPWSIAELEVTARLLQINPKNGILSLPFSVGTFALVRLDSPLFKKSIGQDVYIKITNIAESQFAIKNPQYTHTAEFIVSDLDQLQRKKVAETLLATISEYYQKYFNSSKNLVIEGTPEKTAESKPEINSELLPEILPVVGADTESKSNSQEKQPDSEYAVNIDLKRHIDPVIVKALIVFALAGAVMIYIVYAASQVNEDTYKDHGKEYTELFKRMKDPEYSKQNPSQRGQELKKSKEQKNEPKTDTPEPRDETEPQRPAINSDGENPPQ
ncbi:MAG: hypothetical protein NT027_19945 [Proteobacteria bacterium]|nr:hypothetical protein [Pseudomonadota bacterium]